MMPDCKHMTHPFQTDPGTSQGQRVLDDLLGGNAKIDNRSLADLLDFFVQLSRHINYYDETLQVSDWQPFFQKSLPFVLASIIKYDRNAAQQKLDAFKTRFYNKPSKNGLWLLLRYTYTNIIKKIDHWDVQITDSGLPIETTIEKLMKDKLSGPLRNFIKYSNAASQWYGLSAIRFNDLAANPSWALTTTDLYAQDDSFKKEANTKRKRLIALYNKVFQLVQAFHDAIRLLAVAADQSMDQGLLPLKEELKEKHPPHLALLFAFIKLFQHLQGDLNNYTKRHLDFFYKQVLQLKPNAATPDKLHLVLDIQQQLDKYLFKKGLLFKDGKDNNKAEIIFASDDEIVVNKAQVVDQRTLFINNKPVKIDNSTTGTCDTIAVAEGVYIAPDATKANGIDKDFKDGLPSRATLGDKWSKYADPENKFIYPYPNARLGFVLASPVLLLNEGNRTIHISLSCQLKKDYCKSLVPTINQSNPCCDGEKDLAGKKAVNKNASNCAALFASFDLFTQVNDALSHRYFYISRPLIAALVKKGIGKDLKTKLQNFLVLKHIRLDQPLTGDVKEVKDPTICYCGWEEQLFDITVKEDEFIPTFSDTELAFIKDFIYPRNALSVLFSGEKAWIAPLTDDKTNLSVVMHPDLMDATKFTLDISAKILAEQKAITFYNAEALKEDFNTVSPLVKIELEDKIKVTVPVNGCSQEVDCCLDKKLEGDTQEVSLYHFFREVKIIAGSKIDVQVCGLKNFVVQNDESLQDVNAPIYPFGTRPDVVDFDIKKPFVTKPINTSLNLIGPNFYIGSKEVFCKKWRDVCLNIAWKDLPTDFHDFYKGYVKDGVSGLFGLDVNRFMVNYAILEDGSWKNEKAHVASPATEKVIIQGQTYNDRLLFDDNKAKTICTASPLEQTVYLNNDFFNLNQEFSINAEQFAKYDVSTRVGFMKINLQVQDFCQKVYSYVLARQMMALGKLPDGKIEDAVYYDATSGNLIVFSTNTIKQDLIDSVAIADRVRKDINDPNNIKDRAGALGSGDIVVPDSDEIRKIIYPENIIFNPGGKNLTGDVDNLEGKITGISTVIDNNDKFQAIIPNEPWTPIISNISIDYTASASETDIDLIHLYPFAGTYKPEVLLQQPMLFPTFCDEGNFFIGLQNLVPGSTLSILFQLSEATADSESEREALVWYYLQNNEWKLLRNGFEVLHDDTNGLTSSGVIKFSMPANMTNENSVMQSGLYWIKAAIPCKSKSVAEIIGIYTQAIKASFTNEDANDKLRLDQPLEAGSVAKLKVADAAVKKVSQPYESFGGRKPEEEGHYYIRVSELLRHKNRAIQKFDFERIVLESFPTIFKAKCINHTYALDAGSYINDFTIAPGYVLLAVIPDLNQLKAAKSFEPKAPVSLLEQIEASLKKQTSPFVRLSVMNPRYEKVNICIRVKLLPDKDEVYYKEQLSVDIRTFLAPWAIGDYEKLSFGQPVSQSDMVHFIESLDYIDYIIDLKMAHEMDNIRKKNIKPVTARSILIGGTIDICIDHPGCESWCGCADPAEKGITSGCCDHPPIPIREDKEIILT